MPNTLCSGRSYICSAIVYTLTLILGITVARLHIMLGHGGTYAATLVLSHSLGVLLTTLFVGSALYVMQFVRARNITLGLVLLLFLAIGAHYAVDAFRAFPPIDLIAALFFASAGTLIPVVLTHDLGMMVGIAGVAAMVGVTMSPTSAMAVMLAMSLSDFLAVYRGRLFGRISFMIESGAIFGFIIPVEASGLLKNRANELSKGALLMGVSDVAMPLLLACSAANESLARGLAVAFGGLVGMIMANSLLGGGRASYVAGLPPIVTASILAYILASTLGL